MKWPWRKQDPMFPEKWLRDEDPAGVNTVIATGGVPEEMLWRMKDDEIRWRIRTLVLAPDFKADVEYFQRELQRRAQVRTNRVVIALAIVAAITGCVQAFGVYWMISH